MNLTNFVKQNQLLVIIVVFSLVFLISYFLLNKDSFGATRSIGTTNSLLPSGSKEVPTFICTATGAMYFMVSTSSITNNATITIGSANGTALNNQALSSATVGLLFNGYVTDIKFDNEQSIHSLSLVYTSIQGGSPATNRIYTYCNFTNVYAEMSKTKTFASTKYYEITVTYGELAGLKKNYVHLIDYTNIFSNTIASENTGGLVKYVGSSKDVFSSNLTLCDDIWWNSLSVTSISSVLSNTTLPQISTGFSNATKPSTLDEYLSNITYNNSVYAASNTKNVWVVASSNDLITKSFANNNTVLYIRADHQLLINTSTQQQYYPTFIGLQAANQFIKDSTTLATTVYNENSTAPMIKTGILTIPSGTTIKTTAGGNTDSASASAVFNPYLNGVYTPNVTITALTPSNNSTVIDLPKSSTNSGFPTGVTTTGSSSTQVKHVHASMLTLPPNVTYGTNYYLVSENSYINSTGVDIYAINEDDSSTASKNPIYVDSTTSNVFLLPKYSVWNGATDRSVMLTSRALLNSSGKYSRIVPT